MAEQPVLLIARFKAKPDRIDEVRRALVSLLEPTRAEEGCLFYHLHRDRNDPAHFVFYEGFRDQSAFDVHVDAPYIKGFLERSEELLASPHDVVFLESMD